MTWVGFRKYLYVPFLTLVFGVAIAAILVAPGQYRLPVAFGVLVLLLLPGFVGRRVLSDLFASRALLNRSEHTQALEAAERFLKQLSRRPWIRYAIWTQYGVYTLSVEAMATNNAGAALLELRRFSEARAMLLRARRTDPAYPIPLYNLAVIAKLEGDEAESERLIRDAAVQGFAGGRLDVIVQSVGETYARLSEPHASA